MTSLSYTIGRADASRIANAVVRYQLTVPRFWIPIVAALVIVSIAGGLRLGVVGATVATIVYLLAILAVIAFKRRQLNAVLVARGYRPGTTITVAFRDADFVIDTPVGSGVHEYGDIAHVARIGAVVLLRMRAARYVLALPAELVPDERLRTLRAGLDAAASGPPAP